MIEKTISLPEHQWGTLDQIQKALGHSDPSQTVAVLVSLGLGAVTLITPNDKVVQMMSGKKVEGNKTVYERQSSFRF